MNTLFLGEKKYFKKNKEETYCMYSDIKLFNDFKKQKKNENHIFSKHIDKQEKNSKKLTEEFFSKTLLIDNYNHKNLSINYCIKSIINEMKLNTFHDLEECNYKYEEICAKNFIQLYDTLFKESLEYNFLNLESYIKKISKKNNSFEKKTTNILTDIEDIKDYIENINEIFEKMQVNDESNYIEKIIKLLINEEFKKIKINLLNNLDKRLNLKKLNLKKDEIIINIRNNQKFFDDLDIFIDTNNIKTNKIDEIQKKLYNILSLDPMFMKNYLRNKYMKKNFFKFIINKNYEFENHELLLKTNFLYYVQKQNNTISNKECLNLLKIFIIDYTNKYGKENISYIPSFKNFTYNELKIFLNHTVNNQKN